MSDRDAIDALVTRVYAAFRNKGGVAPAVDSLRGLFLADARIVKAVGAVPEIYTVDAFIESRRALLTDGSVVDFDEWEIDSRMSLFGHVASRWSLYRKVGMKHGVAFDQRGLKSLQFAKHSDSWRIAGLVWDDERPGLALGDRLPAE